MVASIEITGDPQTGAVQCRGVIDDMRIVHWLLGEAMRICQRRAAQREAAEGNGHPQSGLVVVRGDLPKLP